MTNGRVIFWCMVGCAGTIAAYELVQWIKPLFIALCDAGRGGC